MSYVVNKTNGNIVAVVEDGTIDSTSTSLSLVGRGVNSYGEIMAENLVKIMEHFASPSEPAYAMAGQLWWDSSEGVLKAFDGAVWTAPTSTAFYASDANTTGTGTITVVNDAGITIGDTAKASLGVSAGSVALRVGAVTPTLTALTVDPVTGRVQTPHIPVSSTDLVNKNYADNLSQLSSGVGNTAIVSATDFTVTLAGVDRLAIDSAALTITGAAYAETPDASADDLQVATTEFVQLQKVSPMFTGEPSAPTAAPGTSTGQLATTAFVQDAKVSPSFTGVPMAPTAAPGTNTDQIATTAFVNTAVSFVGGTIYAPLVSAALTGVPTAPTALPNTVTDQIATTAYVQQTWNDFINAPYAPKANPQLTGIPTAPTAVAGTNNSQLANTAFVQSALSQRLDSYLPKVNAIMQGIPTAPTAELTVSNNQVASTLYATSKAQQIVDAALLAYQNFVITYGTTSSQSGFTNIVAQFSNAANYFDVFPPSGKNMSNLAGFLPSIAEIHYNGSVNRDDSMRCVWSNLGDRIRVYVQNTEQRSAPAANWIAFWR